MCPILLLSAFAFFTAVLLSVFRDERTATCSRQMAGRNNSKRKADLVVSQFFFPSLGCFSLPFAESFRDIRTVYTFSRRVGRLDSDWNCSEEATDEKSRLGSQFFFFSSCVIFRCGSVESFRDQKCMDTVGRDTLFTRIIVKAAHGGRDRIADFDEFPVFFLVPTPCLRCQEILVNTVPWRLSSCKTTFPFLPFASPRPRTA